MEDVRTYAYSHSENRESNGTAASEEITPTANVFLRNSSAKFGDNVDVRSELILIPNQKLHNLPVVASQLIDNIESKKSGIEMSLPQKGLPRSFLSKRVGLYVCIFFILAVSSIALSVSMQGETKSAGDFVPREKWGAEQPKCAVDPLKVVPKLAIIHHTDTTACTTLEDCTEKVKSIQRDHQEKRGWCDIGYNFLVGGDGRIYEGRGYAATGAHTRQCNYDTLGIAFLGDFVTVHPSEQQLQSAQDLLENTARIGHLTNNFKICGRGQLSSPSSSPGEKLSEDIEKWPRYTADPRGWIAPSPCSKS